MDIPESTLRRMNDATNAKRMLFLYTTPEGDEEDTDLLWVDLMSQTDRQAALGILQEMGALLSTDRGWEVTPLGYEIAGKLRDSFDKLHFGR